MFEWDEVKRKRNLVKHGIDFAIVWDMDWANSVRWVDTRKDYGEIRYVALAPMGDDLFLCVYTERGENKRIISLREANRKEEHLYEEEKTFDE